MDQSDFFEGVALCGIHLYLEESSVDQSGFFEDKFVLKDLVEIPSEFLTACTVSGRVYSVSRFERSRTGDGRVGSNACHLGFWVAPQPPHSWQGFDPTPCHLDRRSFRTSFRSASSCRVSVSTPFGYGRRLMTGLQVRLQLGHVNVVRFTRP